MIGKYFCQNGDLKPISEALFSMDDIAVVYGYGAYETLKIRKGILYFPDRHARRLHHSCEILGIPLTYSESEIVDWLVALIRANGIADCNLKMMIHGHPKAEPIINILALNPLYPKRKEIKKGTKVISFEGLRHLPNAKSFSMLLSSVAFQEAQSEDAYDAIFVSPEGEVLEGTRTNLFFVTKGQVFTPPKDRVLEGITRETIIEAAKEGGIPIKERSLYLRNIQEFSESDGLMISSTSTKIMPVHFFDEKELSVPEEIHQLQKLYDQWLQAYADSQIPLVHSQM